MSLLRPHIDREECHLCVQACPTQAMDDFSSGTKIHGAWFACASCIGACRQEEALGWWGRV